MFTKEDFDEFTAISLVYSFVVSLSLSILLHITGIVDYLIHNLKNEFIVVLIVVGTFYAFFYLFYNISISTYNRALLISLEHKIEKEDLYDNNDFKTHFFEAFIISFILSLLTFHFLGVFMFVSDPFHEITLEFKRKFM